MKETAGGGALLVNPESEIEITEAMKRVVEDQEFCSDLRRKGLERAKMFSWEKTAKETIKVYEKIYKS